VSNLDRSGQEKQTRTFLAIDLENTAKRAVAAWMATLMARLGSKGARHVKWVEEPNLHLTLHFFGGLTETQIAAVSAALEPDLPLGAFDLRIEGSGVFPSRGSPRVIWAGAIAVDGALDTLHRQVEQRLAPTGLSGPDEGRRFAPHLTVGRVRPDVPKGWARDLRRTLESAIPPTTSRVDRITLFASRLSPTGSTYHVLTEFGLRNA
jgi:2'-5' RNA ligase